MKIRIHLFGIIVAAVALAGCGMFTGDVDPPDPATCECTKLRDYLAGLPMIGEFFEDPEITLIPGTVTTPGILRVEGTRVDPDPKYRELMEALGTLFPGAGQYSFRKIGQSPDWRFHLDPDFDSSTNPVFWFESIDGINDLVGWDDPDTDDPAGISAIQAEAIAHLAELEVALTAIAGG